ncbi:MAG: peroxiredoxin [Anaerolineae bacterium]
MLQIGQEVPDFALVNQNGKTVRLSDFRGKKVVLFSFPKADSLGCNIQACAFRDELPDIKAENAVVLGLGVQPPTEMKRWQEHKKLPYDILADTEHKVLEAWGAWGYDMAGLIKIPIVKRSYWVLDEAGLLIDQQLHVGPKESLEKALKAIKAAQLRTASAGA